MKIKEPRLNVTKAFTLHGKTTSNPTKFWLFFDVAYVSPFRFCNVMSDQQQQRDIYVTCDIFVTIFRRLNVTFFRILLPSRLLNNPHALLCCFLPPPPLPHSPSIPPPLPHSPPIPQFSGMWAFH